MDLPVSRFADITLPCGCVTYQDDVGMCHLVLCRSECSTAELVEWDALGFSVETVIKENWVVEEPAGT